MRFILATGGSVAPMLSLVERVRRAQPTLPLIGVIDTPDPFEVRKTESDFLHGLKNYD